MGSPPTLPLIGLTCASKGQDSHPSTYDSMSRGTATHRRRHNEATTVEPGHGLVEIVGRIK